MIQLQSVESYHKYDQSFEGRLLVVDYGKNTEGRIDFNYETRVDMVLEILEKRGHNVLEVLMTVPEVVVLLG